MNKDFDIPKDWRIGQTLFNFLQWLVDEKGFSPNPSVSTRIFDPFYIEDDEFEKLFIEYLESLHGQEKNN